MAESLTTEHAYLSVSSFPIVVLTEAGVLDDGERTRVMECLEALLEEGGMQFVVIDVSEGEALPESQRMYVADLLKMRSKDISALWAAMAIVVGSSPDAQAKAEFWLEVSPVPARVFQALDPAMAWARTTLGLGPSLRPSTPQTDPIPARASRLSEPRTRKTTPSLEPRPSKVAASAAKASRRTGFLGWLLSPRGLLVLGSLSVALVLLLLSPPPDDSLSGADAAMFAKRKAEFTVRVSRLSQDGKATVMRSRDKVAVGDRLSVEMDLPAPGYTMLFSLKAGGSLRAIWPTTRAGRLRAGLGLRPPRLFTVEEGSAQETFFVAYCAERFVADECTLSGAALQCPEGCVTKDFVVEK